MTWGSGQICLDFGLYLDPNDLELGPNSVDPGLEFGLNCVDLEIRVRVSPNPKDQIVLTLD